MCNTETEQDDYQLVKQPYFDDIDTIEGTDDFVAYDGTVYPYAEHLIINAGKYQIHEDNASDEIEMYVRVDMDGVYMIIGTYVPFTADDWIFNYQEACNGNHAAIDYIMRLGMVEEGFRTMTAYGYDYEGWDLIFDWDFNWIFVQHGSSCIDRLNR